MKIIGNSPRLNNLSVYYVDEKFKNADNLLINSWFFICISIVDNVGVDHLKKNHSRHQYSSKEQAADAYWH